MADSVNKGRRRFLGSMAAMGTACAVLPGFSSWAQPAEGSVSDAEILDAIGKLEGMSGVVAIQRGQAAPVLKAYGLADRERSVANNAATRFNIASIGKLFTAVAIAQLWEKGKFKWNTHVTDLVPDLPAAFSGITIEHLLTNRSGLGSYFFAPNFEPVRQFGTSVADYMTIVKEDRPAFTPGERYAYSNNGFVLLGAVIEQLTGMAYDQAIREKVLQPAGMHDTAFVRRDALGMKDARGYTAGCFARPPSMCTPGPITENTATLPLVGGPAGGIYASAPDMLSFARALRDGTLLHADTMADMKVARVPIAHPGAPLDAQAMGFDLVYTDNAILYGHNGGTPGAAAQLDICDAPEVTTVVLCNIDGAERRAGYRLRKNTFGSKSA